MPDSMKSSTSLTSGSRMETLYATALFSANLWSLLPQDALRFEPGTQAQWLVIAGEAACQDGEGKTVVARPGHYLSNPHLLEGRGNEGTTLLELSWQPQSIPHPLAEVTEQRPWGSFTVLKDEPAFKLKQLMVKPGSRLSLQRHQKREEHWLVTAGNPEVTLNDTVVSLRAGSYIHIPLQAWHRISNPAAETEPVEIIELQLGEYFGEDDIERREDDYGRC